MHNLKKILIIVSIFLLLNKTVYAKEDILNKVYSDIVAMRDSSLKFENITYSLTYDNYLADNFLIQFPGGNIWGIDPSQYKSYTFNSKNDADFGLPHCTSDQQCMGVDHCQHLNAFFNGISGQNTKMCIGMADKNLDKIYNTIIKANHFVDITTLQSYPDKRFKATLRNALTYLAYTGKPITVRLLDGIYDVIPTQNKKQMAENNEALIFFTKTYLSELVQDIKNIPQSRLKVYIAGMRSCSGGIWSTCSKNSPTEIMALSWNHSKIIDVDGKYLLTGGVNLHSEEYLEEAPVFDMMVEISGPTAAKTIGFTNMLWNFVREHIKDYLHVIEYAYESGIITSSQLPNPLQVNDVQATGNVEMLGIGRTGGGILADGEQENTSDLAMYLVLNKAHQSIYLSQQSMNAYNNDWPFDTIKNQTHTNIISALASLLINNGNVYVVTSPDSNSGGLSGDFSSKASKDEIWNKIKDETRQLLLLTDPNTVDDDVNRVLCGKLHVSHIQFSNSKWEKSKDVYQHHKFIMIDERIFYVGSQNAYPANLQEYGYFIDDAAAANHMVKSFWNPLWKYSSANEYSPAECTGTKTLGK